jgi:hypothetical protein
MEADQLGRLRDILQASRLIASYMKDTSEAESVDDTVARLRADGAELIGEVAQYEDKYRLCYMRGPAGIIVALAEELF